MCRPAPLTCLKIRVLGRQDLVPVWAASCSSCGTSSKYLGVFQPFIKWADGDKNTCTSQEFCILWVNSSKVHRALSGTWQAVSDCYYYCCCLGAKSCLTLCNPMDCSLPGSSVHGISQARILEWVAMSFSKGSSQHRNQTWVSCIAGRFFTVWAIRGALSWFWLTKIV